MKKLNDENYSDAVHEVTQDALGGALDIALAVFPKRYSRTMDCLGGKRPINITGQDEEAIFIAPELVVPLEIATSIMAISPAAQRLGLSRLMLMRLRLQERRPRLQDNIVFFRDQDSDLFEAAVQFQLAKWRHMIASLPGRSWEG